MRKESSMEGFRTALKLTGAGVLGAGVLAGAGYGGYRLGANRASNAMASAFSEANQEENQGIYDQFNTFNQQENESIAQEYLNKGIALGAHLQSTNQLGEETMDKQAYFEEIYNASFNDELEKISGKVKESFKNLGSGLTAIKNALTMRGAPGGIKTNLKRAATETALTIPRSKGALAILAGGGAAAAGGPALAYRAYKKRNKE